MGTAPALAKDTAGAEPAGKAEEATAARPEVSMSWAQDKVMHGHEVEMPPQEKDLALGIWESHQVKRAY